MHVEGVKAACCVYMYMGRGGRYLFNQAIIRYSTKMSLLHDTDDVMLCQKFSAIYRTLYQQISRYRGMGS